MLIVANYFVSPWFSLPRTGSPSSRLAAAQEHIQARVGSWHEAGKSFALLPEARKELHGPDYTVYALWETVLTAENLLHIGKGEWCVTGADGRERTIRFVYRPAEEAVTRTEPGWSTYVWLEDGHRGWIEQVPASTGP